MFPAPLTITRPLHYGYSESACSFTAADFEYGDLFALMQRNECHISAVCSPLMVTTATLSTNYIPHTHARTHTHTRWSRNETVTALTPANCETFLIQSMLPCSESCCF